LAISGMNAGGAQRVAATLVSGWAWRGDDVTLLTTDSIGAPSFYPLNPAVRYVALANLPAASKRFIPKILGRSIEYRRFLKQSSPDALVSFLTNTNVVSICAALGCKVPVVVSERVDPTVAHEDIGPTLRVLRRCLYPFAAAVTVQVPGLVARTASMLPQVARVVAIPNPLPPELPQIRRGLVGDSGRYVLAAMGRLEAQKQFDRLIAAFACLAADFPLWDVCIWGEGSLRTKLSAQVARLGLTDRVRLPGVTSDPWESLARCDAFALTSAFEGFPNVLMEAMALGLPCVTFDCPSGPRDISENGTVAELVPLNDDQKLVAALRHLLGDSSRRSALGAAAAQSIRQRYSLQQVLEKWDALFESVRIRGS
jgi:GalNAc-alpha-(1->4)-GalNAc-alpha-(1->3)-diNAcBac-PP-undecaprenol alpha-1,4-N-acetyl-D-galactosaminyltransferase